VISFGLIAPYNSSSIDRINPIVSQIVPNEANRGRYEADHVAFKALYVNNRATMRRSMAG